MEVYALNGEHLGSGSGDRFYLSRALRGGELVVAIQETPGGCRSRLGRGVSVLSSPSRVDGEDFVANLSLDLVVANPGAGFVPPLWDSRVFEPTQNRSGGSLALATAQVPNATMGSVMLGQPVNAFVLHDVNGDGQTARLAHDCGRVDGGGPQRGPLPMFEHPDGLPGELTCTGVDYRPGANLIFLFEFAATAGGQHATQFLAIHGYLAHSGELTLLSQHGGDLAPSTGDGGRVMNLWDRSDFPVVNYQLSTGANGRLECIRGAFQQLRMRYFEASLTYVAETQSLLSGSFDLPVYED